jgi:hypothetical protein
VSQQKTIDEVATKVCEEGDNPNEHSIAVNGILAGLQMAAEVCDKAAELHNDVDQLDFQVMARLLQRRILALAEGNPQQLPDGSTAWERKDGGE